MDAKAKTTKVRVATLEISGLTKDDRARWLELSDSSRDIVNRIWKSVVLYHEGRDSWKEIAEYIDRRKNGEKPKWPMEPIPKKLSTEISADISARYPHVHARTATLLMNIVCNKIKNTKAAKGSLSAWAAILLDRQQIPSTIHGVPIPFDDQSSSLEPPAIGEEKASWKLNLRLSRIPPTGKQQNGTSVLDSVKLWSRGRKAASRVAILKRIASGEYKFCGSQVIYKESNRKWFAAICYRAPIAPPKNLDNKRVAFLRPARLRVDSDWTPGWRLRTPEQNRYPGGNCFYVGRIRQRIISERKSRLACYRNAGSSNKGHGRKRAMKPIWRLQNRWKDFVKTANYTAAKEAVTACVEKNCGKLVFFQPNEKLKTTRTLNRIGQREDYETSSGWDYYQIGKRLSDLCQDEGIEFVWKKESDSEREVAEQQAATTPKNGTARKAKSKPKRGKALRAAG